MNELITIRSGNASDTNFIYATWLRGLYYGDTWFSEIPKQIFMENYHNIITSILTNPTTSVQVMCLKDDPEVIVGYMVLKPETIVWTFIKKNWRGIGLARDLVPADTKFVTHLTKIGLAITRKRGWAFNPFI